MSATPDAHEAPRVWADAVRQITRDVARASDVDPTSFAPLLECIVAAGPSRDGSLRMEWVAPTHAPRFGMTFFEHGGARGHLGVARALCVRHFDTAAVRAWDATLGALSTFGGVFSVGLAWDAQHGHRVKLFVGGRAGMDLAARSLGLDPHERLVGVGCDFWRGGRYRERRYFRAGSVDDLRPLAPAWDAGFSPPLALVGRQHAMLTRTQAADALGEKVTWSAIFPPEATLASVASRLPRAVHSALPLLVERALPFALRPSAYELDRYRDGREGHELLLTLDALPRTSTPR